MNSLVRRGLAVAVLLLVLDQLSKWWILDVVRLPEQQNVPLLMLGPIGLDLTMVWNRGVTFGLFSAAGRGTTSSSPWWPWRCRRCCCAGCGRRIPPWWPWRWAP
jgi:hypothetical protein